MEKRRQLEEKISAKLATKCDEEKSRHRDLEMLTLELRRRRNHLELSIEELIKSTETLLEPKEELKADLEKLRATLVDCLGKQVSELRHVEINIYQYEAKLRQVSVENDRLRLAIRRTADDVSRNSQSRNSYRRDIDQFNTAIEALVASMHQAWMEDLMLTENSQRRDGALLASMTDLRKHLESKKRQLESVTTLQHTQMLHFSKKLLKNVMGIVK
ncbi:uncharacterized protein ccdc175 [Vanacampus margaritifer]